jgi:tetratricopeptide (TPR) repeat protein
MKNKTFSLRPCPFAFYLLFLILTGCSGVQDQICPSICFSPTERLAASWPSPFPPLSWEEKEAAWGIELEMGKQFGRELDLYRAITCFKRAEFLNPPVSRRQEIDFSLFFAYYLGEKYVDAIQIFEESSISSVDRNFPAFDTLVTTLWDAYEKTGQLKKAEDLFPFMSEEKAGALQLGKAIEEGMPSSFSDCYCHLTKSPTTARTLQAILPGAGYLYMGQTKSALTSFVLNALFIWGTVELFQHGHPAWAIFTLSLESGWYLGGINGAGLLARQHNEIIYNSLGKEYMMQNRLFPLLRIECGF